MTEEKQLQYYVKITGALQQIFDKQSEYYIDVFDENFNCNDFIHTLATRVPQIITNNLTDQKSDPLGFNHICNRLILQNDLDLEKSKEINKTKKNKDLKTDDKE